MTQDIHMIPQMEIIYLYNNAGRKVIKSDEGLTEWDLICHNIHRKPQCAFVRIVH